MSDVTARPWKQGKIEDKKNFVQIPIEQGMAVVCYVVGSTNPMIDWYQGASHVAANAKHIVHCVNKHERLVEMVQALALDYHLATGGDHHKPAHALLEDLEAEKGGGV